MAMMKNKVKDAKSTGSSGGSVTEKVQEIGTFWTDMKKQLIKKLYHLTADISRFREMNLVIASIIVALRSDALKVFAGLVRDMLSGENHSMIAHAREKYRAMKNQFLHSKVIFDGAKCALEGMVGADKAALSVAVTCYQTAKQQYKEAKKTVHANGIRLKNLRRNGDKESLKVAKKVMSAVKKGRALMANKSLEVRTAVETMAYLTMVKDRKPRGAWPFYAYSKPALYLVGKGVKFRVAIIDMWQLPGWYCTSFEAEWNGTRAFVKFVNQFDEFNHLDCVPDGLEQLNSEVDDLVDSDDTWEWDPTDLTDEQKRRFRAENDGNRNTEETDYDFSVEPDSGLDMRYSNAATFMRGGYGLEQLVLEAGGEYSPWQGVVFRDRTNAIGLLQFEYRKIEKITVPSKTLARHAGLHRIEGIQNPEKQEIRTSPTAQKRNLWDKDASIAFSWFEDLFLKSAAMAYAYVLGTTQDFGRVTAERYVEWRKANGLNAVKPYEFESPKNYMFQVGDGFYWIWDEKESCSLVKSPSGKLLRYHVTPFAQVFFDVRESRYNGSINLMIQNLDRPLEDGLLVVSLDCLPGSKLKVLKDNCVKQYAFNLQGYKRVRFVQKDATRPSPKARWLLEDSGPARIRSHKFKTVDMNLKKFRELYGPKPYDVRNVIVPEMKIMEYTQGTGIPEAPHRCPMESFVPQIDCDTLAMSTFEV